MKAFNMGTEISDEMIRFLLSCAFEGGSGYWASIEGYAVPEGFDTSTIGQDPDNFWTKSEIVPLLEGGTVLIMDREEGEVSHLNRETIQQGLDLLAKHPRHRDDFLGDRFDAQTGDVFLQLCCLGEIVYG